MTPFGKAVVTVLCMIFCLLIWGVTGWMGYNEINEVIIGIFQNHPY